MLKMQCSAMKNNTDIDFAGLQKKKPSLFEE